MTRRHPFAIAHRGVHTGFPENSMPAILAALELGADGIEIDVHAARDGALVVHHDPMIRDGRALSSMSGKELAAVELSTGVTIPLLDDVLDAVAGKAILFVETKVAGIEFPLLRALRRSLAEAAVHSFHHDTIRALKLTMPAVRAGILSSGSAGSAIAAAHSTNADDVWHSTEDVTAELVAGCRKLGKQLIAWTANSRLECERLQSLGVDGICSDDVQLVKAVAG